MLGDEPMRPVGAGSEDVRTNLDGVKIASELGILPTGIPKTSVHQVECMHTNP
jgi:hypothetical protein